MHRMGLLLCYLQSGSPITPGFQRHGQNSGLHSPTDTQGLLVSHQHVGHQHEPQDVPCQGSVQHLLPMGMRFLVLKREV